MADDGYGKYRKMLKMGLPRLQVNTSMLMDGKDPNKFVEQDPNESAPVGDSEGVDLSLKGDAYDKYRKMLKCGLPMGAAMQAMMKDGVDPKGFNVGGGGGGESADSSAQPASIPTKEETPPSESGGGFLSELKSKAERKAGSSASPSMPPKPAKPIVAPTISPPKAVAAPPIISPNATPELKSTPDIGKMSPSPVTAKNEEPTRPISNLSPFSSKSAPVVTPPPPTARVSEVQSDRAMESVLNDVMATDASPKPYAAQTSEPVKPEPSDEPTKAVETKKWVPPSKQSKNNDDWKGLMAANKIQLKPEAAKQEEANKESEPEHLDVVETKNDGPVRPEPVVSPVAPSAPSIPSYPATFFAGSDNAKPATPSTAPSMAKPVSASPVTTKPAAAAGSGAKTLKKRVSNDWKTMLAPHLETKPGDAATVSKLHSTNPPAYIHVGGSNSNVQAPRPVSSPSTQKPASPTVQPQKAATPSPAPRIQSPTVAPPQKSSPVMAAPPKVAAPPVNKATETNAVGLTRSTEQRLPAWAAVEKPSFLMGKEGTAAPQISNKQLTQTTPVAQAKPVSTPVAQAKPVSPPVEVKKTTPSPPKPTETKAPVMQAATGSIPKGFTRKFAWE